MDRPNEERQDSGAPQGQGDRPVACPQCGAQNRADARWCSSCAQPLKGADRSKERADYDTRVAASPPPTTQPTPPRETPPAPTPPTPSRQTPPSPPTTPGRARPGAEGAEATAPVRAPRPAPPVATPPRPERERAPSRGPVALLAATTVLFFITTVLFGLMALRPQSAPINTGATRAAAQAGEDQDIEDVVTRFGVNLTTFDHATLDDDMDRILADTTENFETQFHTALDGDINVLRDRIRETRSQSEGEVKGFSITSREDNAATVLVIVQQTVRSESRPAPRTQHRLLELALVETDDGWKVDNVANPAKTAE